MYVAKVTAMGNPAIRPDIAVGKPPMKYTLCLRKTGPDPDD